MRILSQLKSDKPTSVASRDQQDPIEALLAGGDRVMVGGGGAGGGYVGREIRPSRSAEIFICLDAIYFAGDGTPGDGDQIVRERDGFD